MKMKSRFLAIILALTLCMGLSTSVYAAETTAEDTTVVSNETVEKSAITPRMITVAGGSTNLSNGTGSIYLTLDSDCWGTSLMFSVMGNPSGQYHCNAVRLENNYYYSIGDVSGNGYGTSISWPYLQKGTYKFYIYTTNQNYGSASAVAQILD